MMFKQTGWINLKVALVEENLEVTLVEELDRV